MEQFPLKKTWKLAENATAKDKSDTSKWRGTDTVSPKTTPPALQLTVRKDLINRKLLPEDEGFMPNIRHPNPGTYTGERRSQMSGLQNQWGLHPAGTQGCGECRFCS